MAGASVESCRFVVLKSLGDRLGSELDMGSRLRRMHGRFDQWIPVRTGAQLLRCLHHDPPKFSIQSSLGAPRFGARAPGDYPMSDLSQRESEGRSATEKSKLFGPDGTPSPSNTQLP